MKNFKTVIQHPSQLNSLSTFSMLRKRGVGEIYLSEKFQHEEREELQSAINKNYYACGCDTSARLLIAGLVIGVLGIGVDQFILEEQILARPFLTVVITTLGGAMLGKVIGLVVANRELKRNIHTVQAFWRPESQNDGIPQPTCG